eukprot:11784414-Alexandrium_andersonii.AAC.1
MAKLHVAPCYFAGRSGGSPPSCAVWWTGTAKCMCSRAVRVLQAWRRTKRKPSLQTGQVGALLALPMV